MNQANQICGDSQKYKRGVAPTSRLQCSAMTLSAWSKIQCEYLAQWFFWIKTIVPVGAIHTRCDHVFFHPVCWFFQRSRARSRHCCTKEWEWWRCFQNQCKQTPKKSILRETRMLSSCYLWYLRTDLFSHVLYTEYNFYSFVTELCDLKSTVHLFHECYE